MFEIEIFRRAEECRIISFLNVYIAVGGGLFFCFASLWCNPERSSDQSWIRHLDYCGEPVYSGSVLEVPSTMMNQVIMLRVSEKSALCIVTQCAPLRRCSRYSKK